MDKLLHGMNGKGPIPSTACIVDDICVTGSTPQEHFANLTELLSRLHSAGLKLNREKCKFYQPSVKFLGKIIDENGQRIDPEMISAIVNMPAPVDKQTLRSFLGHMSYIGKHVADVRLARAPLDELLKADAKFIWEEKHSKAFEQCKKTASNSATLAHFDINKPVVLTTDASPNGLGACLSHRVTKDGRSYLMPIAYASCSLKAAEKNYAQIDREGLAVYWAITHFRQFLYCRHFELQTDCSALTRIFGPKNDLGGCITGRLNRMAAKLMEYDFTATHIKGTANKICDSLSRLPTPSAGELQTPSPTGVGRTVSSTELAQNMSVKYSKVIQTSNEIMDLVSCLAQLPEADSSTVSICKLVSPQTSAAWDILPLSVKDVAKATREDKVYGKLLSAVRSGNLDSNDPDMKPFVSILDGLHIENDVICYGSRVVVPTKQQERLLSELHMTHMGIVKMKLVARAYFWWPRINKQIEEVAKSCEGCRRYMKKPAPAPLCPWPYARRPMERVHIDYCEFRTKVLLIMIDAYTKYIWVHIMTADTTAMKTLAILYGWFCENNGFPTTLVSDNGPQFTSNEFAEKMSKWGIKHILTPPYHPASNGLAEKAVGIIKGKLKKMGSPSTPLELHVNIHYILRVYRATPHTSTGQTPFQLMASAKVPMMFPQLQRSQQQSQEVQRSSGRIRNARTFIPGDSVLVYDTQTKENSTGIVKDNRSNNSYIVAISGKDKHISGDVMRLLNKNNSENIVNDNVNVADMQNNDTSEFNSSDSSSTDSESEITDDDSDIYLPSSSSNYELPLTNVTRKRYRREPEKLYADLSNNFYFPQSRTRSGRI